MRKIRIIADLKYDEKLFGDSQEEKDWFFNDILKSSMKNGLILHSNDIGDEIGTVKVIEIIEK